MGQPAGAVTILALGAETVGFERFFTVLFGEELWNSRLLESEGDGSDMF